MTPRRAPGHPSGAIPRREHVDERAALIAIPVRDAQSASAVRFKNARTPLFLLRLNIVVGCRAAWWLEVWRWLGAMRVLWVGPAMRSRTRESEHPLPLSPRAHDWARTSGNRLSMLAAQVPMAQALRRVARFPGFQLSTGSVRAQRVSIRETTAQEGQPAVSRRARVGPLGACGGGKRSSASACGAHTKCTVRAGCVADIRGDRHTSARMRSKHAQGRPVSFSPHAFETAPRSAPRPAPYTRAPPRHRHR